MGWLGPQERSIDMDNSSQRVLTCACFDGFGQIILLGFFALVLRSVSCRTNES
jgi:hypothetical protein